MRTATSDNPKFSSLFDSALSPEKAPFRSLLNTIYYNISSDYIIFDWGGGRRDELRKMGRTENIVEPLSTMKNGKLFYGYQFGVIMENGGEVSKRSINSQ